MIPIDSVLTVKATASLQEEVKMELELPDPETKEERTNAIKYTDGPAKEITGDKNS